MSNTLTKRSLAVGLALGLGASLLGGVPASADTSSVTLVPSAGSTYNTIIGSPATLVPTIDPRINKAIGGTESEYENVYYIIDNPSGAPLSIELDEDTSSENTARDSATRTVIRFSDIDGTVSSKANRGNGAFSEDGIFGLATPADSDETSGTFEETYTTDVKRFAFSATAINTTDLTFRLANIGIDLQDGATKSAAVSVQVLVDNDRGTDTTDGIYNAAGFDRISPERTVNIYLPGDVSADVVTSGINGEDEITATISYRADINANFVKGNTGVVFFEDGDALATGATAGSEGITDDILTETEDKDSTADINNTQNYLTLSVDADSALGEAIYSARAVYTATNPDVFVGSASPALDLRGGSDSFVNGATASVERNANTETDSTTNVADVDLRTGTKSVTIDVQANSGSAKREAAGIKARAEVEGVTVSSGNDVTVTAAAGTIDARGDKITAFAFTNSKGVASFTINAAAGTKGDALTVKTSVLDESGSYVPSGNETISIDWEDAALSDFKASPASFVSGDPVNVTFTAEDQFGVGMDSTSTGALSVYAEAVVGGVVAPSTYNETVSTVDGAASFSFANFATEGSPQQLKATLREGNSDLSSPAPITVNVYETLETSEITVADEYTTDITYVDFVEGDTDVASVNAAVKAAGLDSATGATMTGTVLDANNAGQPGAAVTVAADGVLFKNGTVYSEDSITFFANEFGSFTVNAYAHEQSSTGIDVTVSTEGFSTTTTLKTYFPDSIDDKNLSFSMSVPEPVVMNTTYAITAKLTDKWGNPIAAKDGDGDPDNGTDDAIVFQGAGAVEINSVGTTVGKSFGSDGTVTVFLRSIKDIAGPGSVTATLGDNWDYAKGDGTTTNTAGTVASSISTDDTATAWDETTWSSTLSKDVEVLETAPAQTSTQKVNAGSFKGYVAVYALGYEGQRLSAKIGKDWVIVDPIVNNESANLARVTDFTGAGVDIAVRIYIDRVLLATIPLTTK